jgi:hypothetical protein
MKCEPLNISPEWEKLRGCRKLNDYTNVEDLYCAECLSEYEQVDKKENRNCQKADADDNLTMCLIADPTNGLTDGKCKVCQKDKRLD